MCFCVRISCKNSINESGKCDGKVRSKSLMLQEGGVSFLIRVWRFVFEFFGACFREIVQFQVEDFFGIGFRVLQKLMVVGENGRIGVHVLHPVAEVSLFHGLLRI